MDPVAVGAEFEAVPCRGELPKLAAQIASHCRIPFFFLTPHRSHRLSMPWNHRRHISRETKDLVVRLTQEGKSRADIEDITTVAESTQRKICALYRNTGKVKNHALISGHPPRLNGLDFAVCQSFLSVLLYSPSTVSRGMH